MKSIAIIGAQGTGKTTLIKKVVDRFDKPFLVTDKVARNCPYPIGIKSNLKAQTWILRVQNLIESLASCVDFPVLTDRALFDQYAYYIYWNGENEDVENLIIKNLSRYEKIFVLPPNKRFLVNDGVRPTSFENQKEMASLIDLVLRKYDSELNIVRCKNNEIKTVEEVSSALNSIIEENTSNNYWNNDSLYFGNQEIPLFKDEEILNIVKKMITLYGFNDSNLKIEKFLNNATPIKVKKWIQSAPIRVVK